MPVIGTDTFTGANGAAWDSAKWTLRSAIASIRNNQGQLGTLTGGWVGANASFTGAPVAQDLEVVFSMTLSGVGSTNEHYLGPALRETASAAGESYPHNGYYLEFDPAWGFWYLHRAINGASTSIASGSFTWTTSQYQVRFRVVGALVQARWWLATGTEPATWQVNFTDPTPYLTPGYAFFGVLAGGAAAARTVLLDNVEISDLASPVVPVRVVDRWNGTALVRQSSGRWNGSELIQQNIT